MLSYTLLGDGTSDSALISIINWAITQQNPKIGINAQFAKNLGRVGGELSKRISAALLAYPCDVLFVHRDSEGETWAKREGEIAEAFKGHEQTYVPIIPVRMTEAWLLSNEFAIRTAAGNRNGKIELNIPPRKNWEKVSNPKQVLFDALKDASGRSGRALQKFSPDKQRLRVAEITTDFSGLRGLESFDRFESDLKAKLFERK